MSLAEQSQQWYPTSVQVTVLQARGLRIKGKNGTNDAYAIMRVAKDKFSTSVAEKSVAPVWKEEASFDLPLFHPSNAERCALQVSVMHRALVGQDKTLGLAVVNLLELYDNKSRNKSEWFKLVGKTGKPDKDRGEVLLDIQFMKNNMTASMFDLSGMDKSRSRLGKLKDKLKGKKKDGMSDSASAIVPSVGQILTDSEGEEEADATPETKKKKSKLKSLFVPKGLHRNISQSMSTLPTLPEKDSAISLSRSSGLNVESPEGKKKFKLFKHKRTDSSDSKVSQGAGSFLAQGTSQSNLCINGSHVYTEDPETRGSRTGSTLSLNSSGHGSMEDLRRGPNRKISTISVDLQTRESPAEEMLKRQEEQRKQEEVRKRLEEERRRQIQEEEREEMRMEEERKRIEREEERKRIEREEEEEEERRRRLEKMEEERRWVEREEERQRREMEEERKRIEREEEEEEERRRLEKMEEERRWVEREEERQRREMEEERKRIEREEEEMMRLEKLEEEKRRMEREEERKQMEERRRVEEEEMERIEEVARIKREHEEERKAEEERIRAEERTREEEEKRIREEKARLEKERMKKEEETRRIEAEKRRAEEEERLRKEKREAEERERKMAEEKERKERERSRLEKEKMELERKEKMKMEQERKKAEEEEKRKLKAEEEKDEMEKKKKEQMNAIETRPEVKPRSARMNAGKKAEKADTIGSEYVPSTDPFEESLLLDENSEALSRSSKVSAVKPSSSVSGTVFSQASPPKTNPFLDDSDAESGNTDNVSRGDGAEKRRRAPKPPQNKTPRQKATHTRSESEDSGEPDVFSLRQDKRPAPLAPDVSKNSEVLNKERTSSQEETNLFTSPVVRTAKHGKGPAPAKPSLKTKETLKENSASLPEPKNRTIHHHQNVTERALFPDEASLMTDSCLDQPNKSQSGHNLDHLLISVKPVLKLESKESGKEDLNAEGTKKKSHAPLPPATTGDQKSTRQDQDGTSRIHSGLLPTLKSPSTASRAPETVQSHASGNKTLLRARVSPIDAQTVSGQNYEGEPKRKGDAAFKPCRPHAVKPLSTIDNQQDFKENQDNITSAKMAEGVQVKMKAPDVKRTGPYAQLTHEELVNLLEKQKDQLSQKDAKIMEMEQYIDNLLVRVMEEQPSILMSLKSMKKAV